MGTDCTPLLAYLLLYSYENESADKLIKEGKGSLLESSVSHIFILMTLSLSIIKDLMNSSLISTPKKSTFLRLQSLLQLLLTLTYFLPEMRTTTLPPPLCQTIFYQHQPTVSMHLSSFTMPVVVQIIVTFYHALVIRLFSQGYKTIRFPTHLRNSMADTLI